MIFAGEYLGLTGEKLNAAEMMACGLATHYSLSEVSLLVPYLSSNLLTLPGSSSTFNFVFFFCLYQQRLPLIEEALGKLVTDDPSVIEACLEKYCDIVYPDQMSVFHRFKFTMEPGLWKLILI